MLSKGDVVFCCEYSYVYPYKICIFVLRLQINPHINNVKTVSVMLPVIVINNHDSFVYNLVQIVREYQDFVPVVIDEAQVDKNMNVISSASHILLSPGPGLPCESQGMMRVIHEFHRSHHLLGICLGMQAIGEYWGCRLMQLESPKHGHRSLISQITNSDSISPLLKPLPKQFVAGRYHSWVLDPNGMPSSIVVDAYDDEANIAVVHHERWSVHGVQFHPESVMTDVGSDLMHAWLDLM